MKVFPATVKEQFLHSHEVLLICLLYLDAEIDVFLGSHFEMIGVTQLGQLFQQQW